MLTTKDLCDAGTLPSLTISPCEDDGVPVFELVKDFSYKGTTVPAGFKFNGNSVPKILYSFTGGRFEPIYFIPALIHDYLYSIKCDRAFSDLLYYDALQENGSKLATLFYVSVRMFGWIRYN
jgi:hypothetical protein